MTAVYGSPLDMIGNTPIVDVSPLSPNPRVRILGQDGGPEPGGSVKDRIALEMIEAAEADGSLTPGQHDHRAVVGQHRHRPGDDRPASRATRSRSSCPRTCRSSGASCSRCSAPRSSSSPGDEGSNGAVRRAQALAEEHPEWAFLYQYANEANPRAHYEGTGPEIWRDCPEITHFVAGLGTSGTLMGVGTLPQGAEPRHQGAAPSSRRWASWSRACATSTRATSRRSTRSGAAPSCSTASASCGPASRSSGPAAWPRSASSPASRPARRWPARPQVAEQIDEGVIVFIVCDGGWKYLSTGAWTDDLDEVDRAGREDHLLLTDADFLANQVSETHTRQENQRCP